MHEKITGLLFQVIWEIPEELRRELSKTRFDFDSTLIESTSQPDVEFGTSMNEKGNKSNRNSIALVGFVAGVLTVLLVVMAIKGC